MATTDSSASPAHPSTPVPAPVRERVLRGLALYRERADEIDQHHGVYRVPSCSEEGVYYRVTLDVWGEGEGCACEDRAPVCKHLIAATIARSKHLAAARRERGERPPVRSAADVAASLDKMGA